MKQEILLYRPKKSGKIIGAIKAILLPLISGFIIYGFVLVLSGVYEMTDGIAYLIIAIVLLIPVAFLIVYKSIKAIISTFFTPFIQQLKIDLDRKQIEIQQRIGIIGNIRISSIQFRDLKYDYSFAEKGKFLSMKYNINFKSLHPATGYDYAVNTAYTRNVLSFYDKNNLVARIVEDKENWFSEELDRINRKLNNTI